MAWLCGCAAAQSLEAKKVDDKTILATAPGKFETTFTLRKGFGSTWFDLKHDPEKKRDLAPVADENGFFWIKNGMPEGAEQGSSWYANPSQSMELLEANPVRMRVRFKGPHMRYGYIDPKAAWKGFDFELTWTLYASGHCCGDYVLVTENPIKLHHFLAIVKTTGHWGQRGKGEGANEIHPASECGDGAKPGSKGNASWVLQYSNGPTYFTDVLMVFQKRKFGGTYWNEGYQDNDYRTGLNIMGAFEENALPAGRTPLRVMFRIAEDMNTVEDAALYANDYRTPDALDVKKGEIDKTDPGDDDKDGFNEAEGCYVLKSAADGVAFTIHGSKVPRMNQAFKVKGWTGEAPKAITVAGKSLNAGKELNAAVQDGTLLLQLLQPVKEDAQIAIGK
jgi:hypothetical protein